MIAFNGVPATVVLNVCETLLARTQPYEQRQLVLGGVHLKLFVTTHWAGFDRYMLIGQDWQAGFNLSIPETEEAEETTQNGHIVEMFGSTMEVFGVGIEHPDAFQRDMTVLAMTLSDWIEEDRRAV